MKTLTIPAGLCFLLSGLGAAHADVVLSASVVVEPPVPVPTIVPPAPPVQLPPAPVPYAAPRVVVTTPAVAGGQWVYTAQYGWLYMPYGHRFVLTHAAGPYAYVYYPSYGWRWLAAPWVVGSGPYPYFGVRGPFAYRWYRGLRHSHHPMAVHYARLHRQPWRAPRAAAPYRSGHGIRVVRPHAPARAAIVHRPVAGPRARMISQRSHATPARATLGHLGGRRR